MDAKIPLSAALIDQILFAMEDQENLSVLNLETRQLVPCESEETLENAALIPLPEWSSIDGFRMMREFSESLQHPALQVELKAILDSGVGVFRRFKTALKPFDSLFRQWLRFKRRFMESRIQEWAESWESVLSWENPKDSGGIDAAFLTAQDFQVISGGLEEKETLERWDNEALIEVGSLLLWAEEAPDFADFWRSGRTFQEGDRLWLGKGPGGEGAGVLWVRPWQAPKSALVTSEVLLWHVKQEFRGLGLGKLLLETFLADSVRREDHRIVIQPLARNESLNPLLSRHGFFFSGSLWMTK